MDSLPVPLTVMLVDDEPFARVDLRELLAGYREVQVLWEADSLMQARELLRQHTPDILLLDVQLRDGAGFELLQDLHESTHLVFVSGYDEYAVKAFDVNAFDYLLKPVQRRRFEQSLSRILKRRFEQSQMSRPPESGGRVAVRSGNRTESLALAHIVEICCLGGNYTEVVTVHQSRILTRRTVMEWEELLPGSEFVRVHRSTIINLRHVICIKTHCSRGFELEMRHLAAPVSVSRRLIPQVRAALEKWSHCGSADHADYVRERSSRSSA